MGRNDQESPRVCGGEFGPSREAIYIWRHCKWPTAWMLISNPSSRETHVPTIDGSTEAASGSKFFEIADGVVGARRINGLIPLLH